MNIFKTISDRIKARKNHLRILDTPYIDRDVTEKSKRLWYLKNNIKFGGDAKGISLNSQAKPARRGVDSIFLIALTDKKEEPLVIMSEKELYNPLHPEYEVAVVGLAASKQNAFNLTAKIYEDMYEKQGENLDAATFFSQFEEKYIK
ncbi:MAG: hypothetical protein J6N76_08170 [Lachnospiraceae bacterium]|nr:hypothetical protein [Lachnospiraceae bacterium]